MIDQNSLIPGKPFRKSHPFRRAVLRGMAVILPPLLTVVIILWIASAVNSYVLEPVTAFTRLVWALNIEDIHKTKPETGTYKKLDNGEFVPKDVYDRVVKGLGDKESPPKTGKATYRRFVELKYLQPQVVIPVFICVFILVMYFLGKFLAAGMGRFLFGVFEKLIHRLPVIRSVYGSVKQVTDFVLSESQVEYNRVVAVEYPRKGIWSFGLVTGESMLDIKNFAGEEVLSVLIPTSPAPVTGYTVTIRKSEAIDLDITIDQAFQFIVSCGVVVPSHQMVGKFGAALPGPEKGTAKPE